MDKCREAFEAKYKELNPDDKCTLMVNGNYSGWIKQAHWWAWQSRQAEIDFLNAQLGIKRDQIKGFESEIKKTWQAVEEKDKRIEEALAIVERFRDKRYPFNVFCNSMEKALQGFQGDRS